MKISLVILFVFMAIMDFHYVLGQPVPVQNNILTRTWTRRYTGANNLNQNQTYYQLFHPQYRQHYQNGRLGRTYAIPQGLRTASMTVEKTQSSEALEEMKVVGEHYQEDALDRQLTLGQLTHGQRFNRVYGTAESYLNDILSFNTLPTIVFSEGRQALDHIKATHDLLMDPVQTRIPAGERERGLQKAFNDICSLTEELEKQWHRAKAGHRTNRILSGLE